VERLNEVVLAEEVQPVEVLVGVASAAVEVVLAVLRNSRLLIGRMGTSCSAPALEISAVCGMEHSRFQLRTSPISHGQKHWPLSASAISWNLTPVATRQG